jgi:hypothetical protein
VNIMKKFVTFVCMLTLVFGVAGMARALTFLDVDGDHSGPVWMGQILNPSETWVFDLNNDILDVGDINPGDTILSASLAISISDLGGDPFGGFLEFADLSLDGTTVYNDVEVDAGLYVLNVITWVSDNLLNVTIGDVHGGNPDWWPGNFLVEKMTISGEYQPAVPEPSTLLLLGAGVLGLVGLRRKLVK